MSVVSDFFFNTLNKLGYQAKVVDAEGNEVTREQIAQNEEAQAALVGHIQTVVADSFTQMQGTLEEAIVARLGADREFCKMISGAITEQVAKDASKDITGMVDDKLKSIRTEINQLRGGASGHGAGRQELNIPNGLGAQKTPDAKPVGANRGNSSAMLKDLVERNILTQSQVERIMAKGDKPEA